MLSRTQRPDLVQVLAARVVARVESSVSVTLAQSLAIEPPQMTRYQMRSAPPEPGAMNVVLSEDVAARESKHALYGIPEAFD